MDMPRDSPLFQKNACILHLFWTPMYHQELFGLAVSLVKQVIPPENLLDYKGPLLHGRAFPI